MKKLTQISIFFLRKSAEIILPGIFSAGALMINDQITRNLIVLAANHDSDNPVRMSLPPDIQKLFVFDTISTTTESIW